MSSERLRHTAFTLGLLLQRLEVPLPSTTTHPDTLQALVRALDLLPVETPTPSEAVDETISAPDALWRGKALLNQCRCAEALAVLQRAIELAPNNYKLIALREERVFFPWDNMARVTFSEVALDTTTP